MLATQTREPRRREVDASGLADHSTDFHPHHFSANAAWARSHQGKTCLDRKASLSMPNSPPVLRRLRCSMACAVPRTVGGLASPSA